VYIRIMEGLATPKKTLELLKKYRIKSKKALGQNFLIDQNILNKIVEAANLTPRDVVLEIGAGIGTLTQALASRAKTVLAVEFDRVLLTLLKETLREQGNVIMVARDALKLDLKDLPKDTPRPNKMVANLPYNIATTIILNYLERFPELKSYVVMLQKEVGKRVIANPGGKEYGAVSIKIRFYCHAEIISPISRKVFIPQPKVDSVIVKLQRHTVPPVAVTDPSFLFKTIAAAFSHRRKTLKNALITYRLGAPEKIDTALKMSRINPIRRAETLSLEEFAILSHNLQESGV